MSENPCGMPEMLSVYVKYFQYTFNNFGKNGQMPRIVLDIMKSQIVHWKLSHHPDIECRDLSFNLFIF